MSRITQLLKKYKAFTAYVIFGVMTTCVNIASYYLCYDILTIGNVTSTIIAWILATVFAFITNKLWVFESRARTVGAILYELITFYICRIATGVLDVLIMWLAVDIMAQNAIAWKIVSNIVVIVLNYIASKLVIFKK